MRLALAVFWILNLIDFVSTWIGVAVTHAGVEANPLMAWAISHGFWVFFFCKMIPFTLAMVGLWILNLKAPMIGHWIIWLGMTPYMALMFNHAYVWAKYLGWL